MHDIICRWLAGLHSGHYVHVVLHDLFPALLRRKVEMYFERGRELELKVVVLVEVANPF